MNIHLFYLFTEEEYRKGLATLKNNKAAGIDYVLVEQHLGPRAHRWLHSMLNTCFAENKIPKVWRQSRIIAILEPGKYILSVYSPFSDRVGLPPHNTPFTGVLMKSIGAVFLRPDGLSDVNDIRGMQYNILAGNKLLQLYKFVCTVPTHNSKINLCCKTAL